MKKLCEAFRYKFVPTCSAKLHRKNKTLGFAQTQQGNDSPAPHSIKPPPPNLSGAPSPVGRSKQRFRQCQEGLGVMSLSTPFRSLCSLGKSALAPLPLQDIDNRHISPFSLKRPPAKNKKSPKGF